MKWVVSVGMVIAAVIVAVWLYILTDMDESRERKQ